MKEDFLHFIWQLKLLNLSKLKTTKGEPIEVVKAGIYNENSGPDFLNAKIRIGSQLWFGAVEIHINASDWYAHHHETDSNYDSVILHVVWNEDTVVFNKLNRPYDTLIVKDYLSNDVIIQYKALMSQNKQFMNCENLIGGVPELIKKNWLERLYFERLERKHADIDENLKIFKNDWNAVFFIFLFKYFGSVVNGTVFYDIAKEIPYSIIKKIGQNSFQLEALLFGVSGLLNENHNEFYFKKLKAEYFYLCKKFNLEKVNNQFKVQFFRLRPSNFPTIRISQIVNVLAKNGHLFSTVIEKNSVKDFYDLFDVGVTEFWQNHYTFASVSKKSAKKLSKKFIDLLIVNVIVPFKFSYNKQFQFENNEDLLSLISSLKPEQNKIVNTYKKLSFSVENALDSQGLLQLNKAYCMQRKCLKCAIGKTILKKIG